MSSYHHRFKHFDISVWCLHLSMSSIKYENTDILLLEICFNTFILGKWSQTNIKCYTYIDKFVTKKLNLGRCYNSKLKIFNDLVSNCDMVSKNPIWSIYLKMWNLVVVTGHRLPPPQETLGYHHIQNTWH